MPYGRGRLAMLVYVQLADFGLTCVVVRELFDGRPQL
jgi:hypothetical protein